MRQESTQEALGPSQNKTAPLRSLTGEIITDKQKQLETWVEHYSELYSRQNTVMQSAIDAPASLPVMLDLDIEPTAQELSKAIESHSREGSRQ